MGLPIFSPGKHHPPFRDGLEASRLAGLSKRREIKRLQLRGRIRWFTPSYTALAIICQTLLQSVEASEPIAGDDRIVRATKRHIRAGLALAQKEPVVTARALNRSLTFVHRKFTERLTGAIVG